ncbi:hypothetical protein [Streptomyces sp. NPDC059010]|uniref:hypothetical protein n=1 Tax=Streptomyces sp. NPDC059010 TaxID=3346695 RepID=UPI0036C97C71
MRAYLEAMDWGTLLGTLTGAVIGVGATSIGDRAKWRREQSERRTDVKRELYAAYLAAVAKTWNDIRAAVIDSTEPWPERARQAEVAYRNGGVYELRYQMAITAPPEIVVLSDQTMRGIRDLVGQLIAGRRYDTWAELKSDGRPWFDAFDAMRASMRRDLDPSALPVPDDQP